MSERGVALVTGASRGIGRAIARRLAQDGFKVVLTARNAETLGAVAAEIAEAGGAAEVRAVDVGDAEALSGLIAAINKELGGLEVLVNNAGITRDGLIMRMKDQDYDAVLNINLKAAFVACRAASKVMMRARRGRIINVTSVVGLTGNAGQANYAASKAGLIGLTKSLAKELGSRGVTVNAIAPGYITTDMTKDLPDDLKVKLLESIPLGRLGEAKDIAAAASFLAGPDGAYVTGAVLRVDGGMAM